MKHKRFIKLNDNRKIGDSQSIFIAELNTSHFGEMSIAKNDFKGQRIWL